MAIAGVSDDMCFAQRVGVFFDVDAFTAFPMRTSGPFLVLVLFSSYSVQ